jgi:DNA modification methylase
VKLAIADPSYDGKRKSTTSATMRGIDGDSALETQEAITELLKRLSETMAKGGTLALFRPGAALDPAWLSEAIASNGWQCDWALTWNKNKAKPGRTYAPYGIASERILILSREGEKLAIHDDSSRDDILEFKPIQPHHTDADPHHQHEKPLELMKHLIGKHTYEGELVIEPFGGTGSACQAVVELNRHWVYCETIKEHFEIASAHIAALQPHPKAAG